MRRSILAAVVLTLFAGTASAQDVFLNKGLADWLSDLDSGKPAARRGAAFALGRMGSVAINSVGKLGQTLARDPDERVRDMAATAIGEILLGLKFESKDSWREVGATLMAKAQKDDSPRVRRSAAYAIGAFGPVAAEAVPTLREALRSDNADVRQNAAWALGRAATNNSALKDLSRCLADDNALVRRDAASALRGLSDRLGYEQFQDAAPPLFDLVKRERAKGGDEVVLKTALGALASLALAGEKYQTKASELYPLLDTKDLETARTAAFVLGNVGGEPARRAMPVLRKALADPDPQIQELTAVCLANAGAAAVEAGPDLAKLLKTSKSGKVRRICVIALGQIGLGARTAGDREALEGIAKEAIPVLTDTVKPGDGSPQSELLRVDAAEAMARIAYPYTKDALPTLRAILRKDGNPVVRQRTIWSIHGCSREEMESLKIKDTMVAVLDETTDESLMVRYESARYLAWVFREDTPDKAVEVILDMLQNQNLRIFGGSETVIQGVPDESRKGTSAVRNRKGGDARYLAAQALGWLRTKGAKDKRIVDALKKAAADGEEKLAAHARTALKELGKAGD